MCVRLGKRGGIGRGWREREREIVVRVCFPVMSSIPVIEGLLHPG